MLKYEKYDSFRSTFSDTKLGSLSMFNLNLNFSPLYKTHGTYTVNRWPPPLVIHNIEFWVKKLCLIEFSSILKFPLTLILDDFNWWLIFTYLISLPSGMTTSMLPLSSNPLHPSKCLHLCYLVLFNSFYSLSLLVASFHFRNSS